MAQTNNPYLSIVMVTRNDDYQPDAFKRLQTCVVSFIEQAKRYSLDAELIIVEWNPPADRPLLKDAIAWPDDLGSIVVRIIVVPNSVHKRYNCCDKINIMAAPAQNIGVRRAKGVFIATMTTDILLSNELIQFLALKKLDYGYFHKAIRHDVHQNVLNCFSVEDRLDFCDKNILRIDHPELDQLPPGLPALHSIAGDFVAFKKECWHKIHGYAEINNIALAADLLLCYMAYLAGLKEKILDDSMRIYHINHYSKWRDNKQPLSTMRLFKLNLFYFVKNKFDNYFAPNSQWRTHMRRIYGFKQKMSNIFTNIFYSQLAPFFQRINKTGAWDYNVQYLTFQYKKVLIEMLKGKRSYVYNNDFWGLPNEKFTEFVISSGSPTTQVNNK